MRKIIYTAILFIFTKVSYAQAPYCGVNYNNIPCNQPGPSNQPGNFINDFINSFNTTGATTNIVNNNSGCNAMPFNYIHYNPCQHYLGVTPGQVITCNLQSGNTYSQGFAIFIDWNQNNIFDIPAERVAATPGVPPAATWTAINFTVPVGQAPGIYRMRVRAAYATAGVSIDPCMNYGFGEVEDYDVYVSQTPSVGVVAGTASVNNTNICTGQTVTLTLTGHNGTVQWQSAPNPGGPWTNIPGATNATYTTGAITANTCYQAVVTFCNVPATSNTVCVTVNTGSTPPTSITASPSNITCGQPITLTVNGGSLGTGANWVWYIGGCGTGAPVGTGTTINATTNGAYFVRAEGTCNTTVCATINIIQGTNPVVQFTNTTECEGTPTQFTDNSIPNAAGVTTYSWDFGDGNSSSLQNPTHTYSPGTYNATLTVTNSDGCSSTLTQQVTVNPMPVVDYTFTNQCLDTPVPFTNNTVISSGNINQYNWDFGDGNISGQVSPTHQYNNPGTYNVTLTATSDNNCTSSVTYQITVHPMPVAQFTVAPVCQGNASVFQNQSTISSGTITNYDWQFGDGNTAVSSSPSHTYAANGNYTVILTVTSNNGCVATTNQNALVYAVPVVNFSADRLVDCSPLCVNFTNNSTIAAGSINQYLWSFSDGTSSNLQAPSLCFDNNVLAPEIINVTLTATSDMGCVATLAIPNMLTINPNPIANFTFGPQPTTIFTPIINFFDSSIDEITNWYWNFGDSIGTSTDKHPVYTYTQEGEFNATLIVVNTYGCSDTVSYIVKINPEILPFIPNAFTPNGDGLNDVFIPVVAPNEINYEFEFYIFNRWGELIYQSDAANRGWDGTYKGIKVPADVYVWKLKLTDPVSNKVRLVNGHVTLIR
jgi:gliding motility-associated-like protein